MVQTVRERDERGEAPLPVHAGCRVAELRRLPRVAPPEVFLVLAAHVQEFPAQRARLLHLFRGPAPVASPGSSGKARGGRGHFGGRSRPQHS